MSHDKETFEEDALPAAPRRRDTGSGAGTFLAGLALGTLLGVGAALFFNSPRGRKLSRQVRDDFDDWREDAGRELGRRARRARQHAGRTARSVRDALEDTFD
jgi:gas vesicle protein